MVAISPKSKEMDLTFCIFQHEIVEFVQLVEIAQLVLRLQAK